MAHTTVTIKEVLAVPASGAYYYDDLGALQARPMPVAERYSAPARTPGFRRVREVAEAVSIGLVVEDPAAGGQQVAWGDCVAVAYSGKAGRAPLFRSEEGLAAIRQVLAPALRGRELTGFRRMAAEVDALLQRVTVARPVEREDGNGAPCKLSRRDLFSAPARLLRSAGEEEPATEEVSVERPLHPAIRYGASQALLGAAALARRLTIAEVVAEEYGLPRPAAPVPLHAQCGTDRYHGADKMIARGIASLPHALVDDIPEQLGREGERLVQYARWLRERIPQLGGQDYRPAIHLDVHGALGRIFEGNLGKILGFLYGLRRAVEPYPLRVESPVIMDSLPAQVQTMARLRDYLRARKLDVQLVVDEWANSPADVRAFISAGAADMIQVKTPVLGSLHNAIEAVLACQAAGVGVLLGGSCAETDLSARITCHVALALRPDLLMAKPGMDVDGGVASMQNEMARTLAWIRMSGNQDSGKQGISDP